MRPVNNLTNKRVGRLIVIKQVGIRQRHALWLCKCDCGNFTKVISRNLVCKSTRSCGCLRKRGTNLEALMLNVYRDYKARSQKKNINFKLSGKRFKELIFQNCFYCDAQPANVKKREEYTLLYNGIDRKNNNLGYTKGNSVPCCKKCNIAKSTLDYKEFIDLIKRIYNKLGNKNYG